MSLAIYEKRSPVALIDGGEVVYRVAAGSQQSNWEIFPKGEKDWIKAFHYQKDAFKWLEEYGGERIDKYTWEDYYLKQSTYPFPLKLAIRNTEAFINSIKETTRAKEVIVVFGHPDGENFRHELATIKPYKANRGAKPHHYEAVKQHILESFDTFTTKQPLEDDDVLAILHNELETDRICPIICSQDKDLRQVPGFHYRNDGEEVFEISEDEGWINFYRQMYTGDATDTIPGFKEITGKNKSTVYAKNITTFLSTTTTGYPIRNRLYTEVYNTYSLALQNRDYDIFSDLDCILEEIGGLLYMRRSWDDKGYEHPERLDCNGPKIYPTRSHCIATNGIILHGN